MENIKVWAGAGIHNHANRFPLSKDMIYLLAIQPEGTGGRMFIGPFASQEDAMEFTRGASGNSGFKPVSQNGEHVVAFPANAPTSDPKHVTIDGEKYPVTVGIQRAGTHVDAVLKGERGAGTDKPYPFNITGVGNGSDPSTTPAAPAAEETAMERLKKAAAQKAVTTQGSATTQNVDPLQKEIERLQRMQAMEKEEKAAAQKAVTTQGSATTQGSETVAERMKATKAARLAAEKEAAEKEAARAQEASRILAESAAAKNAELLAASGIPAVCPEELAEYAIADLMTLPIGKTHVGTLRNMKEDGTMAADGWKRIAAEVKKAICVAYGILPAQPAVKPEAERPAVPNIVNRVTPPAVAPPAPTPARNNGLAGASPRHLPNPVAVKEEEEVTGVTAVTTQASPGHLSGVHFPCKAWQVRVFNVNPTTKAVTSFDEECSTFAEAQKFANMATRCGAAYTCILPLL